MGFYEEKNSSRGMYFRFHWINYIPNIQILIILTANISNKYLISVFTAVQSIYRSRCIKCNYDINGYDEKAFCEKEALGGVIWTQEKPIPPKLKTCLGQSTKVPHHITLGIQTFRTAWFHNPVRMHVVPHAVPGWPNLYHRRSNPFSYFGWWR